MDLVAPVERLQPVVRGQGGTDQVQGVHAPRGGRAEDSMRGNIQCELSEQVLPLQSRLLRRLLFAAETRLKCVNQRKQEKST